MQAVVAGELEAGAAEPVHDASAGLGPRGGVGGVLLDPDDVDLEEVPGGDDEIGDGSHALLLARGPLEGLELVGGERRGDGGDHDVSGGVGDETGGAVLDAGGVVHHLERRITHGGRT